MSPRARSQSPVLSGRRAAAPSRWSWLALCALGGLTGCPKPVTLRPYPAPTAAELLGYVRHSHDSVLALRARAKADYLDGAAGRVKIDIGLVLAKPNRLRLAGESSLTGPLLTLATDGSDFQLLDVRRNSFMAGKVNPCSMARLIRVALHPREAVEVLLGGVPLLNDGDVAGAQLDWSGKDGGREMLTLRDSRGRTEVLWLAARSPSAPTPAGSAPSGWDVREAEGREASGQVVWRVRHEDFADVPLTDESAGAAKPSGDAAKAVRTTRLPAVTYIEDPPNKSDVRLRWRERELNPNLEPGVFHLDAPPGIPTEPDLCAGAAPAELTGPPPAAGSAGTSAPAP